MRWPDELFDILLFTLAYFAGPIALLWGWTSFIRHRTQPWTRLYAFSFIGFLLASCLGALGLFLILYGLSGALENYTHMALFYRILAYGFAISTLALLFATVGILKSNNLRWQASVSALGTLAFWLIATAWP